MSDSIADGVTDIVLPATLWSWDRLNFYQKWTVLFRGGKGCRCVGLIIVLSVFAVCLEIWSLDLLERSESLIRQYRYC